MIVHMDKATAGMSNVPLAHQSKFKEKVPKRNAPHRLNKGLNLFFRNTYIPIFPNMQKMPVTR